MSDVHPVATLQPLKQNQIPWSPSSHIALRPFNMKFQTLFMLAALAAGAVSAPAVEERSGSMGLSINLPRSLESIPFEKRDCGAKKSCPSNNVNNCCPVSPIRNLDSSHTHVPLVISLRKQLTCHICSSGIGSSWGLLQWILQMWQ